MTNHVLMHLKDALAMTKYPRSGSHSFRICDTTRDECGCEHHHQSHLLNRQLAYVTRNFMPKPRGKNGNNSFTPTSFVHCVLSVEEKKEFTTWGKKEADNLDTLVIEVLQANHKISFSFNDNSDSFICSITGKPEECINASRCFTSHAKDYTTSLWVALFKFHAIWRKGVWEDMSEDADFG